MIPVIGRWAGSGVFDGLCAWAQLRGHSTSLLGCPAPSTLVVVTKDDKLPIRMLHDRILISLDPEEDERRSSSGIVIPATASLGKRLSWAKVVAAGANVRTVEIGDRVLFDPEDRAEVEVRGDSYILLRERDLHAVASERLADGQTGLYL